MNKDEAWDMIDSALDHCYPEKDVLEIKEILAQQDAEAHLQAVSDFGQLQAQPAQEPVAEVVSSGEYDFPMLQWLSANHSLDTAIGSLLYTSPPQRQPLTDEEIKAIQYSDPVFMTCSCPAFARAIEAKLKEKNT